MDGQPIPCRNCGSPACEWPGECKPKARRAFVYARPWLVIQNDAGEWLAPPGVWTINPDRRFNLAEFSGRELAEKLATRYGGRVVTMAEKEPTK